MQNVILVQDDKLVTTSKIVAEVFGKTHKDVLRAIDNLDCSDKFRQRNFAPSSYKSQQNKTLKCMNMNKDGFCFLAMGFTGRKAGEWKEAYIEAFNKMAESTIAISDEYDRLDSQNKKITAAGKEWAAFGHEVNRMKKKHIKECEKLLDHVQFKLDFN